MEKTYDIVIKGTTALLQNRFTGEKEQKTLAQKTKKRSTTDKENDVNDTLYKLPNGKAYQPAEQIRQSMIEAGKAFKRGKSNISRIIASFVEVSPEAIIHKNQKWVTDRRAVVIPSTKGRIMRNRAKFENWSLQFEVKVMDDNELDEKTLHDILTYAGKYLGIGDYRPQKKGMYGKFMVASIK